MEQAHLQGLRTRGAGGRDVGNGTFHVLDEAGRQRVRQESLDMQRRIRAMRGSNAKIVSKQAWARNASSSKSRHEHKLSANERERGGLCVTPSSSSKGMGATVSRARVEAARRACLEEELEETERKWESNSDLDSRDGRDSDSDSDSAVGLDQEACELVDDIMALEEHRRKKVLDIAQLRRDRLDESLQSRASRDRYSRTIYNSDRADDEVDGGEMSPAWSLDSSRQAEFQESAELRRVRRRESWEEEERRKAEEEEAHLQTRFKARAIPSSTMLPRFEEMNREAERRSLQRKLERRAKLETSADPFRGLEQRARKQEARREERQRQRAEAEEAERRQQRLSRTVPSSHELGGDGTYADMCARQERERTLRRDRRAQQLLGESSLPPRLETYAQAERFGTGAAKLKKQRAREAAAFSFKPQVNTTVPDFDRSKRRWVAALARARHSAHSTETDVSDLSMFGEAAQQRQARKKDKLHAKAHAEARKHLDERAKMRKLVERMQAAAGVGAKVTVQMTKSQKLRLQHCADARAEEQRKDDAERKRKDGAAARLKARAKVIGSMVAAAEEQRRAQPGYMSLLDAEAKAKQRAAEDRKVWKKRTAELNEVMSNPRPNRAALVERQSDDARMRLRKQQAVARVAAALVRNNVADDEGLLSREERHLVDEKLARDKQDNE